MHSLLSFASEADLGWWANICDQFHQNFIAAARWKYLTNGLLVTVEIALGAVCVGLFLGFLIASIRATHDKTGKLGFLNFLCKIYLTVIRGTPQLIQLLIIYFVIFASLDVSKLFVAIMAFGINSGAYTAEIVRAGIMAVDRGQFEAGSSLGLNYRQTMIHIVIPQAFKTVLPALANEFITLLKDTSLASCIAMQELTKGGTIIRSQTYNAFMPLIAVALIYLIVVCGISKLVTMLERRLKRNE